ncbi:hypothetical protein P7C70_g3431, partial [Phenoliferia sp. Uapishka_3]
MPGPVYNFLSALPIPALPETLTKWTPGESPLSTHSEVVGALAVYLAVIFGGQYLMADRKPYQFKPLFMVHNFLLSTGSGLVLALMLEEVSRVNSTSSPNTPRTRLPARLGGIEVAEWTADHWLDLVAGSIGAWTPRLETYYIINYLFKYWELFDTVFLVVKKKPLQFLHVFHHTATAALCYTQLNGRTSVSWVVIAANLTVHVLMYYYYLMTTAGYKIWWKKYLTTLQISQFVIDLFVVYFATYSYFVAEYFPGVFWSLGTCSGTEGAALMGCGLLTSYLFLFIVCPFLSLPHSLTNSDPVNSSQAFYRKTYTAAAAAKAKNAGAVKGKPASKEIAEFKKQ